MPARARAYIRQHHVGLLALFLALTGGTAYALDGHNTVNSGDIINDQVKPADVRDDTLPGGGLSGADINESSLNLAAEPWHEVGAAGEPAFNADNTCDWGNFDGDHNAAAFARDSAGYVHLKGLVKVVDGPTTASCTDVLYTADRNRIFTLPAGYRPARREVHATLANGNLGRLNVDGGFIGFLQPGDVSVDPPTTPADAAGYLSLDGITFRCAPSGQDGCP